MKPGLPPDATLRTIAGRLADAEGFVSQAYAVINRAWKDHGDVVMRLGITGTGKAPNYRIETASFVPILPVDGNNHKPWQDDSDFTSPQNWSSNAMSKAEVGDLLREIRSFPRKGV